MPLFAILRHDGPGGLHWDLLLEADQALRTWALPALPAEGVALVCRALPDHRLVYLDYDGEVSGGRGSVSRWDRGTYRIARQDAEGLAVEIEGAKLAGRLVLRRLPDEADEWELRFSTRTV
jgi:hypothetical protein